MDKTVKKLLFVCSENRLRSPTTEAVFPEYKGVEAIGAGTNKDAATPVSGDIIEWADVILVMETMHRNKISANYKKLLKGKQLVVLDIPDNYQCMQPELIQLLEAKVSSRLPVKPATDSKATDLESFLRGCNRIPGTSPAIRP